MHVGVALELFTDSAAARDRGSSGWRKEGGRDGGKGRQGKEPLSAQGKGTGNYYLLQGLK